MTTSIFVNEVEIDEQSINAEVQYHPAETLNEAMDKAKRALIIRELLIERACALGLTKRDQAIADPDTAIDTLFAAELQVPEPEIETCQQYYQENKEQFRSSDLFEVSHILIAAPEDNEQARVQALQDAHNVFEQVTSNPAAFADIARERSACTSARDGGRLGQITTGQTVASFEQALYTMKPGQIHKPVATQFGYHIIKLHECADGRQLPFEQVYADIAKKLQQRSWAETVRMYLQKLVSQANIQGFTFDQQVIATSAMH